MMRDTRSRAARRRSLVLAAALAFGPSPALAQVPTAFVVEGPDPTAPPAEGVAKIGALSWPPVLLSRKLRSETAVRLSQDAVVPAGWTLMGKPVDVTLKAGDVLTGGSHLPGIYCIATPKAANAVVCLRDTDGDGAFDESAAGLCDYGQGPYDLFVWASPTTLCSLKLRGQTLLDKKIQPRALTAPLPYEGVDPSQGPTAWANLVLNQTRKPKADAPGRFYLQWAMGKQGSGNTAITANVSDEVDLPAGGVGQVAVGGLVLDFAGYAPDGGLKYRVTTPPAGGVVWLRRPIVRTVTVVLP